MRLFVRRAPRPPSQPAKGTGFARPLEALAHRGFRLLWLGQVTSSFAQWMDQVSRTWLIYELTGSAIHLGLVAAARGLPLLLLGVLAGALADRSGRKLQLIVAQTTNALLNIVLATLILTQRIEPWHVYATGVMAGAVQAFQQPARQSLISDLVGSRLLLNALALNSAATNVTRMLGPALAGLIIAATSPAGSYYVQALFFAGATIWTIQIALPERRARSDRPREPLLASMGTGLAYVARHRSLRTLMVLGLAPLALGMPYSALMPIFAEEVLHGGPKVQGLLVACGGVGSLIGAVVVASLRRTHAQAWHVALGAAAFGLSLVGFAVSRWLPVSAVMAAMAGAWIVTYRTQNQTLLQLLAPAELRGRVLSIYLLDRGLVPLGTLTAGLLAASFGGPAAVAILGASSVGMVALVVALNPHFLGLRVRLDSGKVESGRGPEP